MLFWKALNVGHGMGECRMKAIFVILTLFFAILGAIFTSQQEWMVSSFCWNAVAIILLAKNFIYSL